MFPRALEGMIPISLWSSLLYSIWIICLKLILVFLNVSFDYKIALRFIAIIFFLLPYYLGVAFSPKASSCEKCSCPCTIFVQIMCAKFILVFILSVFDSIFITLDLRWNSYCIVHNIFVT